MTIMPMCIRCGVYPAAEGGQCVKCTSLNQEQVERIWDDLFSSLAGYANEIDKLKGDMKTLYVIFNRLLSNERMTMDTLNGLLEEGITIINKHVIDDSEGEPIDSSVDDGYAHEIKE
jgi:hypothetical protein